MNTTTRVIRAILAICAVTLAMGPSSVASAEIVPSGWGARESIDGNGVADLSCPTSTFCMAVDTHGDALSFDGSTWSAPYHIDSQSNEYLDWVGCASSSFCIAVDSFKDDTYTWNGSTWVGPSVALWGPNGGINPISCTSASFCVSLAGGEFEMFNGSAWTPFASHDAVLGESHSLSCTSPSFCVHVDGLGNEWRWNGTTWTEGFDIDTHGPNNVQSLSCSSPTFCIAVDGEGYAVRFNGSTWSSPESIDPGSSLESISCASPTLCVALDDNGHVLRYDGNWTPPEDLGIIGIGAGGRVACPTISLCVAVRDENAFVYRPPTAVSGPSILPPLGQSLGAPVAGWMLTEQHGGWTNNPNEYTYQWEDCDSSGNNCASISGATGATYTVASSDIGHTIRVEETAIDPAGSSASQYSSPTGVVVSSGSGASSGSGGSVGSSGGSGSGGGSGAAGRGGAGGATVSGTSVSVSVSCTGPVSSTCTITITLTVTVTVTNGHQATLAHHKRTKTTSVVVGHATVHLAGGRRQTVHVALNGTGKRLLAKLHTLKAKLTVVQAGVAHTSALASRTVTFKAQRHVR